MSIKPPTFVFHHNFISFLSAVPQEFFLPVHHTHQTHTAQASRPSKHKLLKVNP
jgi:hypothetical protein